MQNSFVLVHGFGGSSSEMMPLQNFLQSQKRYVYNVTLSGHETSWKDLKHTHHRLWYRDVHEGVDLAAKHGRVHLVGLSMGASLALTVSCQRNEVARLSLINPSTQLQHPLLPLLPILRFFKPSISVSQRQVSNPDVLHEHYTRLPVTSILELLKVFNDLDSTLPKVKHPLLIFHSISDGLQGLRSIEKITSLSSSSFIEQVQLERSGHIATLDYDSHKICEEILRFDTSSS